eukprot:483781-Rhodomonas_salina.2
MAVVCDRGDDCVRNSISGRAVGQRQPKGHDQRRGNAERERAGGRAGVIERRRGRGLGQRVGDRGTRAAWKLPAQFAVPHVFCVKSFRAAWSAR